MLEYWNDGTSEMGKVSRGKIMGFGEMGKFDNGEMHLDTEVKNALK